MYPIHARIEKPKTEYPYLVSVETGVGLILYGKSSEAIATPLRATAGITASHVSRTIDGSWFLGGLE